MFKLPAPTESNKNRTLLAKYINQFTARNTMDYFIHKDLSGFLRRELDFYIKNEVMRLDDIENADVPAVESYLAKIKTLRKIACKLIDFLAQLEDFQKKLWLKKKFVLETSYCLTLDRVPEELYPEIAANELQHDEWVKLFAINEIERDLISPDYTHPLTVDFLKAYNKLVLDTRFFGDDFKAKLISSIENFDAQCDGLLIHSENLQALNLLQERYCALNNLRFDENAVRDRIIANNNSLREDYMLHYMLDVETKGSQSLLNIDAFVDPTAYRLKIKRPGSDEYVVQNVDLLETFNYLIGLRVEKISGPQEFNAAFKRVEDKEVPTEQKTKLVLDGNMREAVSGDAAWWFRTVEGWVPKDPLNPNNGQREKVLVVWRKLTGDLEKDNVMLDEWFRKSEVSDRNFDTIYVNGSNNLQNIARSEDRWKVILTEEEFMKRMWDAEEI